MRKFLAGFVVATTLLQPVSAFAATENVLPVPFDRLLEKTDETSFNGKTLYRIKGTEAETQEGVDEQMIEFAASFGSITHAYITSKLNKTYPIYYHTLQDANGYYAASTMDQIEDFANITDKMNAWVFYNAPKIIPAGTPASDIPKVVADYVADNLFYDYYAVGQNDIAKTIEYQSMSAVVEGSPYGICTTYATAFNSLVAAAPIDNNTNLVDWNTANKSHWHYDVALAQSETHSWSAIKTPDEAQWHYYDVTWYDGPKDPKYLDMSDNVLRKSSDHDLTALSPIDSTLISVWEQ